MTEIKDMNNFEVHPDNEVTIVFRKIMREGHTIVKKVDTVPVTPIKDEIVQYYEIKTGAIYEGNIKIRIISEHARWGQILQWKDEEEKWVDRTLSCLKVGKYKLITGVTDRLSWFGIR